MRKFSGFIFSLFFASVLLAQGTAPQIPVSGSLGLPGSASLTGYQVVNIADADYTLAPNEWAHGFLNVTSSVALTAQRAVVAPQNNGQLFVVENSTTGGQSIIVEGAGTAGVIIPSGGIAAVAFDGLNYVNQNASSSGITGSGTSNTIPLFTAPGVIGNSPLTYDGTSVLTAQLSSLTLKHGTGASDLVIYASDDGAGNSTYSLLTPSGLTCADTGTNNSCGGSIFILQNFDSLAFRNTAEDRIFDVSLSSAAVSFNQASLLFPTGTTFHVNYILPSYTTTPVTVNIGVTGGTLTAGDIVKVDSDATTLIDSEISANSLTVTHDSGRTTLVAGTATVTSTSATTTAAYTLTNCVTGGTPGLLSIGTVTAGVSFIINSASSIDTSTVCWAIH